METSKRYLTHKISDAAWLEGVCQRKCIELIPDVSSPGRYLFVFDVDYDEGQKLVLGFGCSESFKFDASVKNLKGRLFMRAKEQKNRDASRNT